MSVAIFDANYMARRAFYSGAGQELDNGTIFGFLRDTAGVIEFLQAGTAVFCFDSEFSERLKIYPDYKKERKARLKKLTDAEYERETEFYIQIAKLPGILADIGYRNIFKQNGYEADDLMADCTKRFRGRKFLISSDRDLFQLLTDRVSCWNPQQKKMTSKTSFERTYEIPPDEWVAVKAIAGCDSDDIAGVYGVGEKTAIKYIRGDLSKKTQAYEKIKAAKEQTQQNRILVRLPFPGTMTCEPRTDDNPTADGWAAVAKKLKMPFLKRMFPKIPAAVE